MDNTHYVAALAFGYLLGSIPFGLIFTRLAGTQDIRAIGSGSIGATNVLRTGSKWLAAATLLADVLKGTAAVALSAWWFDHGPGLIAGLGAFLGHLFPVWLKFKGGKGVATYIGVLAALAWPAAIGFCLIWLAVAGLTRYASLAGLCASAATPLLVWIAGDRNVAALFVLLTVVLFIKHRDNIARLIAGTERRIGQKTSGTASPR